MTWKFPAANKLAVLLAATAIVAVGFDIKVAIQQHSSSGSEANTVINNFNMLNVSDQQALLNYLRSL